MKETIYYGGDLLTMTSGPVPKALLVREGHVAALGDKTDLEAAAPGAKRIDLQGAALLPAFIDPHSHFASVAAGLLQLQLGKAGSFAEIKTLVAHFIAENHLAPGAWIHAAGYDPDRLAEHQHPTRALLDAAAPENPMVAVHASGHVGVFNSAALRVLNITAATPVPAAGLLALDEAGTPTGYMEEQVFIQFLKQVPPADPQALLAAFGRAQDIYASHGIATLQEGLMVAQMLPLYQALLGSNLLKLDVVGYAEPAAMPAMRAAFPASVDGYDRHFKLGGYKIILDGSPQARTAWLSRPYLGVTPGEELGSPDSGYCGAPTLTDEEVRRAVAAATAEGCQLLAHCNGDAAAQQFLGACAAVAETDPRLTALRFVMIHAQLLRLDQLPAVKALGVIPSFFVAHTFHWGDAHLRNFGFERASKISPAGSTLRAGIPFTFHQDSPVILPDMLETLWCAANRVTAAGVALDAGERVPVQDALRAVTANAAYQYFEEDSKGTLAPGKRADLVILDRSPLRVKPAELRELRVLATIKDGTCVWHA